MERSLWDRLRLERKRTPFRSDAFFDFPDLAFATQISSFLPEWVFSDLTP